MRLTVKKLLYTYLGASSGKIRNIGSNCAWLCDTAAKIAWSMGLQDTAKEFERLSERFHYGCSDEALIFAQIPFRMHRGEREALVCNGFTSLEAVLNNTSEDIARRAKVSRGRVQGLQKKIVEILGPAIDLQRSQALRLKACGVESGLLDALYTTKGKILEQALVDVLAKPFCTLNVSRITSQNEGEADIKIILTNGRNGIAQVTAKDNSLDKVGLVKATSVLQQSPELQPEVFICFGRPDFDDKSLNQAAAHVRTGKNFKLIPISALAEGFVRFYEGTLSPNRVREILETEKGYVSIDRL
ncbi:MAG: hypothetical protein JWQ71_1157 [Pedosphaera sp.]|nr:hypothetical protein [Pedosphaera sp.]